MMPSIVSELASTVRNVELGQVTVFDAGNGNAIAGAAMGRARVLSESLATLETILGIDLRELSRNIAGNVGSRTDGKHPSRQPEPEPTPRT